MRDENQGRARRAVRSAPWRLPLAVVALGPLCGCADEHFQSALHPASPAAEKIAGLWWFMLAICTAVFVIVLVLLAIAVAYRPRGGAPAPPLGNKFIVISGIILPSIVLIILLFGSLEATVALRRPDTQLTIRVVGHQWWWEVHYPDHNIVTANEIHIPVGKPVRIELETADVIHSFWVPNLGGKMDMIPEATNIFWMQADHPGEYRGQCAEFCGVQHALMAFVVVALDPEEFDAWAAERRSPPPPPEDPLLREGQEAFFRGLCHNCHAIAGTRAIARIGPDLTHIGSRRTIGAGTLPNNHGNLSGWIVNPQPLKPGNKMPRTYLSAGDLHALVAYLESLQ